MALGYSNNYSTGTISLFGKAGINTAYGKLGTVALVDTITGEIDVPSLSTVVNIGGGTLGSASFSTLTSALGGGSSGSGFNGDAFKALYEGIGKDLEPLLLKYSTGKFTDLEEELDADTLAVLSSKLRKQKSDNFFQESIRLIFVNMLEGLQQSLFQYSQYVSLMSKLEACEEKADILNNPEKLKEYLETLKGSLSVIPEQNLTAMYATLKPQYSEYIKLYGVPENLIFDPEKLAIIIKNLGL